jgi:site-specific DNA-cytosine methylase
MATGISLFSGAVDGLGIAFEVAGIRVTHYVEQDAFCCANLRRLHPQAEVIEDDIKNVQQLPYADVVFGGVPCQPFSDAGDGLGFADERALWPEMHRLVQSSRPRCVLVENVLGADSRGLIDRVRRDMEAEGYTCGSFLIPACIFGAPHERYRAFILAYTNRQRLKRSTAFINTCLDKKRNSAPQEQSGGAIIHALIASRETVAHPNGRKRTRHIQSRLGRVDAGSAHWLDGLNPLIDFPGWPAGQGVYQHPYEPPRTVVEKKAHDFARRQSLGNAVIWQQALPFAIAIAQWLEVN